MPKAIIERRGDHDTIIEINTKLGRVIDDIKELKDNFANRVSDLEQEKVNRDEVARLQKDADALHADHERRLRRIEVWGFMALGALGLVELILKYLNK